jgi:hypothetical protein
LGHGSVTCGKVITEFSSKREQFLVKIEVTTWGNAVKLQPQASRLHTIMGTSEGDTGLFGFTATRRAKAFF